jgi:hypothetical protein
VVQHGKVHFGAIYALALLSVVAMYVLLNLMSDGIDVYRVVSVLGCAAWLLLIVAKSELADCAWFRIPCAGTACYQWSASLSSRSSYPRRKVPTPLTA